MRRCRSGISRVSHKTERITRDHPLTTFYQLGIEMSVVKVVAPIVSKPYGLSTQTSYPRAADSAFTNGYYRCAAGRENVDAMMVPSSAFSRISPETLNGSRIFAGYGKND